MQIDVNDVIKVIAIFKLPEDYQEYVWLGKIGIGHIAKIRPLLNGSDEYSSQVISWLNEVLSRGLTLDLWDRGRWK